MERRHLGRFSAATDNRSSGIQEAVDRNGGQPITNYPNTSIRSSQNPLRAKKLRRPTVNGSLSVLPITGPITDGHPTSGWRSASLESAEDRQHRRPERGVSILLNAA